MNWHDLTARLGHRDETHMAFATDEIIRTWLSEKAKELYSPNAIVEKGQMCLDKISKILGLSSEEPLPESIPMSTGRKWDMPTKPEPKCSIHSRYIKPWDLTDCTCPTKPETQEKVGLSGPVNELFEDHKKLMEKLYEMLPDDVEQYIAPRPKVMTRREKIADVIHKVWLSSPKHCCSTSPESLALVIDEALKESSDK